MAEIFPLEDLGESIFQAHPSMDSKSNDIKPNKTIRASGSIMKATTTPQVQDNQLPCPHSIWCLASTSFFSCSKSTEKMLLLENSKAKFGTDNAAALAGNSFLGKLCTQTANE